MVLISLVSGNADAQVSLKNATFRYITCEGLYIKDGYKERGYFGLSRGDGILEIFGDDGKTSVAYLGKNLEENGEMMFQLESNSTTDNVRHEEGAPVSRSVGVGCTS